jgi:hypothetical protein
MNCFRRMTAVAGGAAVVAAVAITAGCESTANQAPSTPTTTTTTPTTTPAPPPTEKNINPTEGNLFSPQVIAPPAPTEPPGVHRNKH